MIDIDKIIGQMTLNEKARILTGKDFWHTVGYEKYGIPEIMVSDGPSGLRKQGEFSDNLGISGSEPAVCYPPAGAVACSFDKDLAREFGRNIGKEGRHQGINVLLAPAINIQRSPLCGRNFEYFSEDPLLTGIMSGEYINGVQSTGLGTCLKHYAVNSQEKLRLVSNSVVDERALHEIYLKGFKIAVENSKPTSIMTSYNKVNGEHVAESEYLLQDFMRRKCGFDGAYISDWGATSDLVKSIEKGLNLEMPGGELGSDKVIVDAVKKGILSEETVNKRVKELLEFVFKSVQTGDTSDDIEEHLKFAQKSSEESMVLLKNKQILPLSEKENILYVGSFCKSPRYQGSGSCKVNLVKKDSLTEVLDERKIVYRFASGYNENTSADDDDLIMEAVAKAKEADKIVIVVGYPDYAESEGYDRESLSLPDNQNKLIEKIAGTNKNIVVILNCGSPVSMPWEDKVKGIIYQNFCGSYGGKALANILYGKVNPSGKLAQSFPQKIEDTPCYGSFGGEERNVLYKESIYVGYRYYLTAKKQVLFPFGYGLSYTNFEIKLVESDDNHIKIKVKNIGDFDGKEVVQMYYHKNNSAIFRPEIELCYFEKIFLKSDEEKEIVIKLKNNMFEVYDTFNKKFTIEDGDYTLFIGNSSINLPIRVNVTITGEKLNRTEYSVEGGFTDTKFKNLYGKEIVPYKLKKPYTIDSTVKEIRKSFFGRYISNKILKDENTQGEMMKKAVYDMPLRSVLMAGYNRDLLNDVVDISNGHIISVLKKNKSKNKQKGVKL